MLNKYSLNEYVKIGDLPEITHLTKERAKILIQATSHVKRTQGEMSFHLLFWLKKNRMKLFTTNYYRETRGPLHKIHTQVWSLGLAGKQSLSAASLGLPPSSWSGPSFIPCCLLVVSTCHNE